MKVFRFTFYALASTVAAPQNHAVTTGGLPFAELKQRSLINDRARAANDDQDFSCVIREGLPQSD
jgi:hypothetical protein